MSNTKLLKNTILYSIGEILPRVINLLLLPLYTRFLSPTDYGIISYTQVVYTFLLIFSTLSLNSYILRFYFVHENTSERKEMIGTIYISIILFNLLLIGIGFAFLPYIINIYQIQVPWDPYFKMALIINLFDCFSIIPLALYRVRQEAQKFVSLGVSRSILTVLLTVYFVVYQQKGVIGTYQAQLYIYAAYVLIYLYLMSKHITLTFKRQYLLEGLKFSLPLLPGAVCYVMLSMFDRLILERNVEIGELGIYNIAASMSLALNIVVQSGYKAIEPEMFKRYGTDTYYNFVNASKNLFFFTIFSCAMVISLFSQEVFALMTTQSFHKGYWLIPALVIAVVMTGQNVIYGGVLMCEKRTKVQGFTTVLGSAISVTINLIFIPIYGVFAAASASALSYIIMNVYLFYKMTFPQKSIWRELLLVILIPAISYFIIWRTNEISLQNIMFKMLALFFYVVLTAKLLNINRCCTKIFINR